MAGAVNRISTVLEVDASKAAAGFREAEKAAGGYESRLGGLSKSIRDNRAEWDEIGNTALVGGAAIAGGLGLATKAAIDWESAWAGVTKTTDGTPEQMAALEEGLRGLAKELPATHEELAGVAEAAGQLGIARQDILAFTETAVALGETTNLSAEEAATGLAKISNVMGTQAEYGIEGIERMGSALVALGNDGASTEADILAMGQRIAGAGETVGATEADVLALANALSSVGIEAQLGGGAMSRALLEMNSAVISGGEELEAFAEISGMTADEFATAWRDDPVAAVGEFVGGLGRISAGGGDAAAALESVGLSGTENAQVFLRAAGASDLLTESLELGASAWEANAALQEEAAKRYDTNAAQIQVSMNRIKDATIDFGAAAAPVVAGAAESIAGLADAYGSLPEPVQTFTSGLAAVTGGTLLLGGAAIKAVGFAQDLTDAFGRVGPAGESAAGGLTKAQRAGRGLAKWGGYAVGIAAVVTALNAIEDAATPAPASIEEVTAALLQLENASDLKAFDDKIFGDLNVATSGIDDLAGSYERLTDPSFFEGTSDLIQKTGEWVGLESDVSTLEGAYARLGESLAGMPADEAAAKFELMVAALGGGEDVAKNLLGLMPAYSDKLQGVANDSKLAADGSEELAGGLSEAEQAAADAEAALDELRDTVEMLGGGLRGERAAQRDYNDAVKAAAEIATMSADEQGAALDSIADKALAVASAQIEMGRSSDVVAADLAVAREAFIQAGVAAGDSRPYMESLADAMGLIPENVETMISQSGAGQAQAEVLDLDTQIQLLDGKTVSVKEAGAIPAKGRVLELDGSIFGLSGKTVKVTEIGATPSGDRVVSLDGKIYRLSGKTVDVNARVYGTDRVQNLQYAIAGLRDKSITVTTFQQTLYRNQAPSGGAPWNYDADGGLHERGAGGLGPTLMANGGSLSFSGQLPHIRPAGGAGVTWAEEGAGPWEAWISGHPAKVGRSRSLADEVVGRLGGAVVWPTRMADGGMREYGRQYATSSPAPIIVKTGSGGGASRAPMSQSEARMIAREFANQMGPELAAAIRGKAATDAQRVNAQTRSGGRG